MVFPFLVLVPSALIFVVNFFDNKRNNRNINLWMSGFFFIITLILVLWAIIKHGRL